MQLPGDPAFLINSRPMRLTRLVAAFLLFVFAGQLLASSFSAHVFADALDHDRTHMPASGAPDDGDAPKHKHAGACQGAHPIPSADTRNRQLAVDATTVPALEFPAVLPPDVQGGSPFRPPRQAPVQV